MLKLSDKKLINFKSKIVIHKIATEKVLLLFDMLYKVSGRYVVYSIGFA